MSFDNRNALDIVSAIEKINSDEIVSVRVVRMTPDGDSIVRVLFDPYSDGERVYFNRYRVASNGQAIFHKAGF